MFQNPAVKEVILISIGVLAIAYWLYRQWQHRRRTHSWKKASGKLGLRYYGNRNRLLERFPGFRLFSLGHRRGITQGLAGIINGMPIHLGDFFFSDEVGGAATSLDAMTTTFCVATADDLCLPSWKVRSKDKEFTFLEKVIGLQDIVIDEDCEFSEAYWLQGDNEDAVRALFSSDIREWFVSRRGVPLVFEGCEQNLLLSSKLGTCIAPEEFPAIINDAIQLARLMGHKSDTATESRHSAS